MQSAELSVNVGAMSRLGLPLEPKTHCMVRGRVDVPSLVGSFRTLNTSTSDRASSALVSLHNVFEQELTPKK